MPGWIRPDLIAVSRIDSSCSRFNRRTRTNQIAVAIRIINSTHGGPEFSFVCPGCWKRGLAARIRVRPLVGAKRLGRVRRVLQCVIVAVGAALFDGADLLTDRDHRVAEAVELG